MNDLIKINYETEQPKMCIRDSGMLPSPLCAGRPSQLYGQR